MATYYCQLDSKCSNCNGVLGGIIPAYSIAIEAANATGKPLCSESNSIDCVGVAGVNSVMFGNMENYYDDNPNKASIPIWGSGLSISNGLCYKLTGSNHKSVYVAVVDRCGGNLSFFFLFLIFIINNIKFSINRLLLLLKPRW